MNSKRSWKLVSLTLVVLSLALIGVVVFCKTKANKITTNAPSSERVISLPSMNPIVYTRCYNGNSKPNYCNLYSSSIDVSEEQLIFKFEYPKNDESNFQPSSSLELLGTVDNQVIYKKSYWQNINSENVYYSTIGTVSLLSGNDNAIFQQTTYPPVNGMSSPQDTPMITSTFVDKANHKFYFTTQTNNSIQTTIHQFDLNDFHQNVWIIPDTGMSYGVKFANQNQLYLSHVLDYVSIDYYVSTIFDLTTQSLTSTPIDWLRAVINDQGTKVAYIDRSPVSPNGLVSVSLKVADIDGKNIIELYSVPSTYLPVDGSNEPYASFGEFSFNSAGNILNYTLVNRKVNADPSFTKYFSVIGQNVADSKLQKGIVIMPIPNPSIYKIRNKFPDPEMNYHWIKYTVNTWPFEGTTKDAFIYKADGGWYFVPYDGNVSDRSSVSVDERKIIAVDAENLIVVSK